MSLPASPPPHLHIEPIAYTVRAYAQPNGAAHGDPYEHVMSLFLVGNGRARIFATDGDTSHGTVIALAPRLQALGVHTVLLERHGIEREWDTRVGMANGEGL